MKATVCVGISASGKTHWAKSQKDAHIICRDDIRRDFLEQKLGRSLVPGELWKLWKWSDEKIVTQLADDLIYIASKAKYDIIIADTNLSEKYRSHLIQKLQSFGYDVEIKEFPVDFMEAVRRDNGRADGVGMTVLRKQFLQWNDYIGRKKYVADPMKLTAILVDIDGTAAHMHDRGPFEWDKVDTDTPDRIVRHIVNSYDEEGVEVIFMSGRDSVCREKTKQWLDYHGFGYSELFMRAAGDSRKDDIVKEELFWNHIADKYNVIAVFDDRSQVVRRWEEMGLRVIQCGQIHSEF